MMGGGGYMQAMNNSLRNNKKLLRRKNRFKKEKSFLNLKEEHFKAEKGKVEIKKVSQKELSKIRNKIRLEKRKTNYKNFAIASVIVVLFSFFAYKIYDTNLNASIKANMQAKKIELKKKTDKYLFFITEGDKWIEKGNWHNVIFQYKKALEVFPNEYEANYRLAYAYSYRCEQELKDCKKGKELLNKLLKQYPNKNELLQLKDVLVYEYSDN